MGVSGPIYHQRGWPSTPFFTAVGVAMVSLLFLEFAPSVSLGEGGRWGGLEDLHEPGSFNRRVKKDRNGLRPLKKLPANLAGRGV
ncbi:MAG: hypothetical protein QW176_01100 [Candidatus Bathyarchaeia archaeon]